MLTNLDFLRTIFREDYRRAWVTGFVEAPEAAPNKVWRGDELQRSGKHLIENPENKNTFFAISLFTNRNGDCRRSIACHDLTHVIMIDDVGEGQSAKVSPMVLRDFYKIIPTYAIETSPGNEQWGLVLDKPESRAWLIDQIQSAMINAGIARDTKDPGMRGVTRYARLPEGVNNKTKYGKPFHHIVRAWNPEVTYSVNDLAQRFNLIPVEPAAISEASGVHDDNIIDLLIAEGMVKSRLPNKTGGYDITCPWLHEHTDGRDDGTAYFLPGTKYGDITYPWGAFACHHGHCENRTLADLRRWLTEKGHIISANIDGMFENYDVVDSEAQAAAVVDVPNERVGQMPSNWLIEPPQPIDWLMQDVIPTGIIGGVIAPGGTGKTFFELAWAMSIATGKPLAQGLWTPARTGATLTLLGEEDEDMIRRRSYHIAQTYTDPFASQAENQQILDKIAEHMRVVSVRGLDVLLTQQAGPYAPVTEGPFAHMLYQWARSIPNLQLIQLDPISRFRSGDENDNMTATRLVQVLEKLSMAIGVPIVIYHHAAKRQTNVTEVDQTGGRGASALTDGLRWQAHLRTMTQAESSVYSIHQDHAWRYVQCVVTKQNYGAHKPAAWLVRDSNGALIKTDLSDRRDDAMAQMLEENLQRVCQILSGAREAGILYSRKSFIQDNVGRFEIGEKRLRSVISHGLEMGVLIEINDPTNTGGRGRPAVCLVVRDDYL